MTYVCSKRAYDLVTKARLNTSGGNCQTASALLKESPINRVGSSPVTSSPVSSWWDEVYEATDLVKINRKQRQRNSATRKLFESPVKCSPIEINHNISVGCDRLAFIDQQNQSVLSADVRKARPPNAALLSGGLIFKATPASALDTKASEETLHSHEKNEMLVSVQPGNCSMAESLPNIFITAPAENRNGMPVRTQDGCEHSRVSPFSLAPLSASASFRNGNDLPDFSTAGSLCVVVSETTIGLKDCLTLSTNEKDQHVGFSSSFLNEQLPDGFQNSTLASHPEKKMFPSHLKIREAKVALNSGKEHINHNGVVRKAREIKTPCHDQCRRCKGPRLTHEDRLSIHKEFWALKDHAKQWMYIFDCLKIATPKRKLVSKSGSKGQKLMSRVYYFGVRGQFRKICKTMFKSTLSICDSWIDSAISHCSGLVVTEDQRGKHSNRSRCKK